MTPIFPALAIRMRPIVSALSLGVLGVIAPCLAAHAEAATVEVRMLSHAPSGGRGFDPAIVHIHAGDTVHFVAADPGHNVQSIAGMEPEGAAPFSGPMGHDLSVTFSKPGLYGYKCLPHYWMGMVGLVVVDKPVNEQAAKAVSQPGAAGIRFKQLFETLDHG